MLKNSLIISILLLVSTYSFAGKVVNSHEGFIGSNNCQSCHAKEYQEWQGSHHQLAMQHATDEYVLGDFNNVKFMFNGKENRFYRKDKEFWVYIEESPGVFKDYQIKFTFGFEPLQQYMVEFDDGRVQLIPFSWDSRPKDQGGQRWFHLYPEQTDTHNEFHWLNTGQNWNYMCADCHSTNVKKNFDVKTNTYSTSYDEITVGCEACHGPGQGHLDWLADKKETISHAGFNRSLIKPVSEWRFVEGQKTLQPGKIQDSKQTLVCAQCHSRHVQISENDYVSGNAFGERYLLSLINNDLYYPDGQIYDENYVYGSYLQSAMARKGVVCSDCHNPHTAELKMPKEQVCMQCHVASEYATPKHHNHPLNTEGAQCVNCHMPETTYMQVDDRADHAWHIPRPDIAQQVGTPDTCLSCHDDKDSAWSLSHVKTWFPNRLKDQELDFAPVFAAIDQGYRQAASALSHIGQNKQHADIIRASALGRMAPVIDQNTLIAIARGVKSDNEYVNLGAIRGAQGLQANERWQMLEGLLDDDVLATRIEAAGALIPLWQELSAKQIEKLMPAYEEYMQVQAFNADRGFSHTNRGNAFVHQGDFVQAEKAYLDAIKIEPHYASGYLNLADLHRRLGKNPQAIKVLQQAESAIPDSGQISHTLGLAYVRLKQPEKAKEYLKKAVEQSPDNAQYQYVLGISLIDSDFGGAQKAMFSAFQLSNNPQYLYALCDMQLSKSHPSADTCLTQLQQVVPPQVIDQLKAKYKKN